MLRRQAGLVAGLLLAAWVGLGPGLRAQMASAAPKSKPAASAAHANSTPPAAPARAQLAVARALAHTERPSLELLPRGWYLPIERITGAQLRARAAVARLNAAQTARMLAAFRRKFQARMQHPPSRHALAALYARAFTRAQLQSLLQNARRGAPVEPMVLFPRYLQLRLQVLDNWELEGAYVAMQDAMASFPQMENEPASGRPGKLAAPKKVRVNIYPSAQAARSDLAAALARARREHKRVLLDFGGNWCYDCHVLDQAFLHSRVTPILRAHFVVVHINIGTFDRNLDLAARYQVPLKLGVPALAVLSSRGRLLYSQGHGEFQDARSLAPADVARFLEQWAATH